MLKRRLAPSIFGGLLLVAAVEARAADGGDQADGGAPHPDAAAAPAPPSPPPPVPAAREPAQGAGSGSTTPKTSLQAESARPASAAPSWFSGKLELKPRGTFIVNAGWNSGTMNPVSFVFYALPVAVSKSQFYISPQNTVLGFGLDGLSVGRGALSGGLDITLRSPTPLATSNTISPQFYDVHIQLEYAHLKIILGQYPDILLPFVPDTANSFPSGYLPGAIGYARPQLRADGRLPFGQRWQLLIKGSFDQPIQTFDLSDGEAVGRQGGRPDGQGRLALAYGTSRDAKTAWDRPLEIGVGGHTGLRRVTIISTNVTNEYRIWSIAGDLRLRLPWGMLVKARLWKGSLMGDYVGGIFQTVDLTTGLAVHAWGVWGEIQQHISERWRVAVLYGRDDPRNSDLSMGDRSLNQAYVVNLFWDASAKIGFAVEGSRWATSYFALPTNKVWRIDTMFLMRF
jgi:hypothetical protein